MNMMLKYQHAGSKSWTGHIRPALGFYHWKGDLYVASQHHINTWTGSRSKLVSVQQQCFLLCLVPPSRWTGPYLTLIGRLGIWQTWASGRLWSGRIPPHLLFVKFICPACGRVWPRRKYRSELWGWCLAKQGFQRRARLQMHPSRHKVFLLCVQNGIWILNGYRATFKLCRCIF